MTSPILAARYATRFSCIGGDCEDTCCTGWTIGVDATHYKKLKRALSQTKADRELFDQSIRKVRSGRTDTKFALIVLNEKSGYCNYLNEKKLCGLHARFGEPLLADVCSTYPRRQSIAGERIEMAAVLSCPEAARQALLHPDSMELVDGEGMTGRDYWVQVADLNKPDTYEGALDVVRAALMSILASGSLVGGLGTITALADVLDKSFGKNKPVDVASLVSTLEDFTKPERVAQMDRELGAIEIPLSVPMLPLLQMLSLRLGMPEGRFREVLQHAIKAYEIPDPAIVGDVARAYATRRDALAPFVDARLSEILTNYALNHVFSNWYTAAPNLGIYVRGLLLRIALVRFLVFAHPDTAALSEHATEADCRQTVERVTIEIVYKMSRAVEHHRPFLDLLDLTLPGTMVGLEHAVTLLKL